MPKFLLLFIFLFATSYLFGQEIDKKKLGSALYVDSIITVKAPVGTIKELIAQITTQNKGIPAIDTNQLALSCKIPAINAESVRLGIFFMALNNYYDAATETLLTIKTDNQAVYIKGQSFKMAQKQPIVPSNDEFTLFKYAKNNSIKSMLESNVFQQIIENIKTNYELIALSFLEEKKDDLIYLYGTPEGIKITEKLLNKIEKVWLLDKNQKFLEILDSSIKEEKIESLELKIKEIENTLAVYNIHKNNALAKLDNVEGDQKENLKEIADLKMKIEKLLQIQKKLNIELDKIKKSLPAK